MPGMEDAMEIQREQLERLRGFLGPTEPSPTTVKRQAPITFSNPAAEQFFVDGTTIPDGAIASFLLVFCIFKVYPCHS